MRKKPRDFYTFERNKARIASAVLHGIYLLLAIFGLPSFLMPEPPAEPVAISVEILPVTGITNVRPSETEAPAESKPQPKEVEQKPSPPAKAAEVTPPEPAPVVKTKEKKPAPVKEEKKPEPKKEKKTNDDSFDKLLKDLKKQPEKTPKDEASKTADKQQAAEQAAHSNSYNPSLPMSMSETDAIMSQIAKCWSVPAGAKDAQNLVPILWAEYGQDGALLSVTIADEIKARYNSDSFFRAAVDSAIRATKQCTPLKGLPPEKYNTWRSLELHFDPRFILN